MEDWIAKQSTYRIWHAVSWEGCSLSDPADRILQDKMKRFAFIHIVRSDLDGGSLGQKRMKQSSLIQIALDMFLCVGESKYEVRIALPNVSKCIKKHLYSFSCQGGERNFTKNFILLEWFNLFGELVNGLPEVMHAAWLLSPYLHVLNALIRVYTPALQPESELDPKFDSSSTPTPTPTLLPSSGAGFVPSQVWIKKQAKLGLRSWFCCQTKARTSARKENAVTDQQHSGMHVATPKGS